MKLVLGIICLIACTIMGIILSNKYTVRSEFYNDFCEFNSLLKKEISFSQNSLLSFMKKFSEKTSVFYKTVCANFFDKKDIILDKNMFKEQELEYFKNYVNNLGSSDKSSQINFLENATENISCELKKAKEEEKKYKSLYVKMGFLIGLIILIILL